jgi:hypothetical protein
VGGGRPREERGGRRETTEGLERASPAAPQPQARPAGSWISTEPRRSKGRGAAHDPCSAHAGSRELRPCSRQRGGRGRRRQRGVAHGHVFCKGWAWIQRHRTTRAPRIHHFTSAVPDSGECDRGSKLPCSSRIQARRSRRIGGGVVGGLVAVEPLLSRQR